MRRATLVDARSRPGALRGLVVVLVALAVLSGSSIASAQDYFELPPAPDLSALDALPDVAAALEAMLFVPPIGAGVVALFGGWMAEGTDEGREAWFVIDVIFAVINLGLAPLAIGLAIDGAGDRETRAVYAVSAACAGVADLAMAIILRVDLDDEVWPRAVVLRDANGALAPGLALRGAL